MFTSFFGNLWQVRHPLSISIRPPDWYTGPEFLTLAPRYDFFMDYKEGCIDALGFTQEYYQRVLNPLNAEEIYDTLTSSYGHDVTLLCYEKPGEFCHRRLVAAWLERQLGVEVQEFSVADFDEEAS